MRHLHQMKAKHMINQDSVALSAFCVSLLVASWGTLYQFSSFFVFWMMLILVTMMVLVKEVVVVEVLV